MNPSVVKLPVYRPARQLPKRPTTFCAACMSYICQHVSTAPVVRLTAREVQLLLLLPDGHSNKQLGPLMGIGTHTPKQMLCSIMAAILPIVNRVSVAIWVHDNRKALESKL